MKGIYSGRAGIAESSGKRLKLSTFVCGVVFFLGWSSYGFELFAIGDFSVTLFLLSPLILLFFVSLRRVPKVDILLMASIAFLHLASILYVIIYGAHVYGVFSKIAQLVLASIVFFYFRGLDRKQMESLEKGYWVVFLVVFIYAIYQFIARNIGLDFAYLPITNIQINSDMGYQRGYSLDVYDRVKRVSSFFPEPSDLGRFALWGVAFAINSYDKQSRAGNWLSKMTLTVITIFLSQALGALLGLLIIGAIISFRGSIKMRMVVIGVIVLGVVLVFGGYEKNALRLDAIFRGDVYVVAETGRFRDISYVLNVIEQSPFLGWGAGFGSEMAKQGIIITAWPLVVMLDYGFVGIIVFGGICVHMLLGRILKVSLINCRIYIGIIEGIGLFYFAQLFSLVLFAGMGLAAPRGVDK